jgi:hypothetical protein
MGACAVAADIAELDRIDPAAPRARIAGIMIARPMCMLPPGAFPEASSPSRGPASLLGVSRACGVFSQLLVISCISSSNYLAFLEYEIRLASYH